jgi:hypothetical protein
MDKNIWQVSSNGESINPKDYPYLIEWVNSAKRWVKEYKIREFISANEEGLDPSGRVTEESKLTKDSNSGSPIPASLIWSSTGFAEFFISSELEFWASGTHMVYGWYIGEVPHDSSKIYIPSMMHVCKICLGTGSVSIPENYSMEDRDPDSKFEIREDKEGLHYIPLEYTPHEDEWEVEFECRQNICTDSWILLEDTDFSI